MIHIMYNAQGMFLCVSASFDFGCFVVLIVSFCKRVVPQLKLGIARYINLHYYYYYYYYYYHCRHENNPQTIGDLKTAITARIRAISIEECVRVIDNSARRLQVCLQRQGNTFWREHKSRIICRNFVG